MATTTRSLTLRLPESLYQEGVETARRRHQSLNTLLQEGLAAILKEEREKELFDAFTLAGADSHESDVEFAFVAQSEVVLRDDTE